MATKFRDPHHEQPDKEHDPTSAGDPPGERLERATSEGKDLLAKANAAIKKGLSTDSETFLAASRQTGGQ